MLEERARLARELHDTLGQVCAFVNTQGQTVLRLMDRGDISLANDYVQRIIEVSKEADLEIRQMILGLCASPIDQGLYQTLQRFLGQYERTYGIQSELDMPPVFRENAFEPQVEVQLLRILQEALTNVRKHADSPIVRIAFGWDDGFARVTIRDTGRGFVLDERKVEADFGEHVGLRMMGERAAEVGGTLTVDTAPGQGTTVVVRVPTTIGLPFLGAARNIASGALQPVANGAVPVTPTSPRETRHD
jgi:signal transduction histidine kinase